MRLSSDRSVRVRATVLAVWVRVAGWDSALSRVAVCVLALRLECPEGPCGRSELWLLLSVRAPDLEAPRTLWTLLLSEAGAALQAFVKV